MEEGGSDGRWGWGESSATLQWLLGFMVPSAIPRTLVQNPEFIFMPIVHLFTTTRVSFSPKPYEQRNR